MSRSHERDEGVAEVFKGLDPMGAYAANLLVRHDALLERVTVLERAIEMAVTRIKIRDGHFEYEDVASDLQAVLDA